MQMIWLLGAAAPAKKVHFNLNGSELRGFPIKARSGQSSILYANPLAPKAVARFCLCPAVITGGQCAHADCLSKWAILMPLSAPYPSCHSYSKLIHTFIIPSHHFLVSFLFSKGFVTYVNGARLDRQVNHQCWCAKWFQLHTVTDLSVTLTIIIIRHQSDRAVYSTNNDKTPKALHMIMWRTNSISCIKCPLNWIWACKPI